MTEDADLRARIEAQVAARRAASEVSENRHPAVDEAAASDEIPAAPRSGGPQPLAPARPWHRAREETANDNPEPSGDGVEASDQQARDGRLRPARPWQTAAGGEPGGRVPEVRGTPEPSHPDVVLRGIAGATEPPVERTGRASRMFRRRRAIQGDDEAGETFALPEPDAAFDEPWLLRAGPPAPHPTRDRSRSDAPPVSVPEPEPEAPRAEPEPEAPRAEPEAEAVAAPAVELVKQRPAPGPRSTTRRPRPATADTSSGRSGPFTSDDRSDGSRVRAATKPADDKPADNKPAHDEEGGKRAPRAWRGTLVRTTVIVAIAVLAALLLRVFVVQPYYIPSASMEPTLHGCAGCNDDHVLVDKFSYRIHGPRSGDIVVFHRPKTANPAQIPETVLIKRVVAVGGDKIAIRKGRVYVNTLVLDESYLNKDHSCYPNMTMATRTVPKNDVFVMGDNRCNSLDSRTFGPIPVSSIIGRAFAIIWPLKRIRLLH